ncbi:hypothetical protein ISN45_Aa08g006910 [Arabidopsis thaliana x Arabidopsis arenosa]|uniref:Uncharacterized protein n=1 Tax=Arabidopsis thaliana x Arabidopsis arenosa TaxID=1240361 RepID=A0A8T1XG05_9BRAS|nr:hypothetical protein ISN45_Aa08g006910 [Arabidopsis thaliana x Arabidopsis arenosa]
MSSSRTCSIHPIEISTPPTEITVQIQDDYDKFKKAEEIFIALDLPKHTRFYWTCINTFKEQVLWRKYFIDIAESTDKDKLHLLETITGVLRNNEYMPKQLGSD